MRELQLRGDCVRDCVDECVVHVREGVADGHGADDGACGELRRAAVQLALRDDDHDWVLQEEQDLPRVAVLRAAAPVQRVLVWYGVLVLEHCQPMLLEREK